MGFGSINNNNNIQKMGTSFKFTSILYFNDDLSFVIKENNGVSCNIYMCQPCHYRCRFKNFSILTRLTFEIFINFNIYLCRQTRATLFSGASGKYYNTHSKLNVVLIICHCVVEIYQFIMMIKTMNYWMTMVYEYLITLNGLVPLNMLHFLFSYFSFLFSSF